jgi:hypothetical protein
MIINIKIDGYESEIPFTSIGLDGEHVSLRNLSLDLLLEVKFQAMQYYNKCVQYGLNEHAGIAMLVLRAINTQLNRHSDDMKYQYIKNCKFERMI